MSKTRIYKVKTPTGDRLVESPTKGQAVKHCVDADYTAEVISASEALRLTAKGVKVETVAMKGQPAKKPSTGTGTASQEPKASTPSDPTEAAQSTPQPSTTPVPSNPQPPAQQSAPTTPPSGATAPQGNVQGGSFIPPQPVQPGSGVAPNPVLAEQQRINPDAAAAAGAPPLPPADGAPAAQGGPVDWEARERATAGDQ